MPALPSPSRIFGRARAILCHFGTFAPLPRGAAATRGRLHTHFCLGDAGRLRAIVCLPSPRGEVEGYAHGEVDANEGEVSRGCDDFDAMVGIHVASIHAAADTPGMPCRICRALMAVQARFLFHAVGDDVSVAAAHSGIDARGERVAATRARSRQEVAAFASVAATRRGRSYDKVFITRASALDIALPLHILATFR